MKRLLPLIYLAVLLAAALASGGAWYAHHVLHAPLAVPDSGLDYEIRPGSAFSRVCNELAGLGLLSNPAVLRWYGQLSGKAGTVHAGEYRIEQGETPLTLLNKFVRGDVRLHSFTIVEGWNIRELQHALTSQSALQHSLQADDWPALLQSLGADYEHPEGLFLPETYRFPRHTTDRALLGQAYDLMQTTLAAEWQERADGLPLATPYEALILASIVEKETARADERPRIAGVFVRRLQKRMRLQTDPTVIYGMGEQFDGNLRRRDLSADTDYNTYTRRGLPPTPIALPGRAAIHAALHPADGNELYFVATGAGDGSHTFSETKEQHDRAVREFVARQRRSRTGTH